MEAAAKGARSAGGLVIGILPGEDRSQANPFVDVAIVTGLGEARNVIIARTAHAIIAVGGEYGTLSEMAFARKFGRPVVSLGSWEFDSSVLVAMTAGEAVEKALGAIAARTVK
jgi:uncharacterized protein (TIGR00725 family)